MTDEFDDLSASAPHGAGAGGARTGWTPGGGWGAEDADDENWDDWDDIEPAAAQPVAAQPVAAQPVAEAAETAEPAAEPAEVAAEPLGLGSVAEVLAGMAAPAVERGGGNDLASAAAAWLMKREGVPAKPGEVAPLGESPEAETPEAETGEAETPETEADEDRAEDLQPVDASDGGAAAEGAAWASAHPAAPASAPVAAPEYIVVPEQAIPEQAAHEQVVVPEPPKLVIPLPAQPIAQTGHRAVDEALRSLDNAAGLPVSEQVAAFEAAHHTLRETLSTIDEA